MNSNSVRPTLYIGLGGTGGEVLLALRRKILMNSWGQQGEKVKLSSLSEFPCAQFIHFDLDNGAFIDSVSTQSEDLLFHSIKFTDEEKIVESFDMNKYSRDDEALDKYPHIKEWLPLTPNKIRELNIDPSIFRFIFAKIIYLIIHKSISRILESIWRIRRIKRLIRFFRKFKISIPFLLRDEWAVASCY